MMDEDNYRRLRLDIWNEALHCFGKSYLYGRKAKITKKWLSVISFLGIAIPIIVGTIVTNYGSDAKYLEVLIYYIAAPLSVLQLVLTVWSLSDNWSDKANHFFDSQLGNTKLSDSFKSLGKYPPETYEQLKVDFDKLIVQRDNQNKQDVKYDLTDKERRKGMRFSLRQFKRKCYGCNKIPTSMKSTDCGICGKF